MMEYKLGDLCIMKSGGTPRRGIVEFYGGDIPWVKISDFKNSESGVVLETEETITQKGLEVINNRLFPKGTLLLAMYGSVGKTAFTGTNMSCNQAILGILSKDKKVLDIKFLKYWLETNKEKLVNQGRGVTLNNISATIVKKQKINLPDLHTQNKIVAILDKVSVLIQKRLDSIALLDELLKAQFLEIFGDPVFNPKKYSLSTLENLCHFITKGTTPKAKEIHKEPFENSVPYLKVYNISQDGSIDFHHNPSYVSQKIHSNLLKRSKVYPNDVLMNIVGPPLGKIGIVDSSFLEWNVNQAIVIFRCGKSISPIYLIATLRSKNLVGDIIRKAVGVRQLNISLEVCRNIVIPVPPIELQNQFETIYHKIQAQKETLIKSKSELENLYNSLLQRAFNGQLNFNVDIELDALLASIDLEQDTEKEEHDIKEIATVYAGRLLERIEEQKFENQIQYKQAKEVVFQMLKDGILGQEYDKVSKSVKLNLL